MSDDLIAAARLDFGCFFELAFKVLHPGKKLIYAQYLDLLITLMESCAAGLQTRVIVNLPPGYMKSMLISIMYVAWRLGIDPTRKIACISYGEKIALEHSASTRKLMQSPMYRAVFPGTVLVKQAEGWLRTAKGGLRYTTTVGGQITGFRPSEIILDDPIEPEDAFSEAKKEAIRSWLATEVMTRFEDNENNLFVLVMHRVAPDDISGTLKSAAGYLTISLPLVAEEEEIYFTSEDDKTPLFYRKPGDFLNPGRMTAKQLEILKEEISPHAFDSQLCMINSNFGRSL